MIDYKYEVFLAVATKLSFSKAAQELFVSQPSVSKQIKILEDEAGVPLFLRNHNQVQLTDTGEKLLDHLRKAKLIQKEINSEFASTKRSNELQGDLKIGASTTISLYVMPEILAAFHKQFPQVNLLLVNRNSENILKALTDHEVDLACIESGKGISSLQSTFFMKDEIIAVCSRNSPFLKKEMSLEELLSVPIALRERGSGTLEALKKSLDRQHVKLGDLKIVARLGGTEALKNYLVEGEAIGFLSRLALNREIENGELHEIRISELKVTREFNILIRRGEGSIGLMKMFMKMALNSHN